MKNVLVVAAHADDETLGCGGTIARHVNEGDNVFLLIMADGVYSRPASSESDLDNRNYALKKVQSTLGITSVYQLNLPDNQMDKVPLLEIVQQVEKVIDFVQPCIIYTHHHGDLNSDHKLTNAAVLTACRPFPDTCVREIYGFEIISSSEWSVPFSNPFLPVYFVNITHYLPIKLKALEFYREEMREPPHSRSIHHAEILARHRGYSVGIEAAEGFEVYRLIR